ncbi:hypothetical protein SARC_12295 [Sphaeroforma arctica JP610]|uniref:Uncharacterized protein n=1 Tax=Sphaeroforma arctica JP610 TaxID=667725 RepID=A0A0L0FEI5_9EUKA|nr:hypothetical protein SARC_12295 [Sphaeroforma arctica JP610]KNC75174.1 hypothetical protein SARC_12295 [Sphaeroforma arctica JP610]|eukprot:XP_014149076.1 hypothetical protein SARC_12295 [Sphaeroforma arctica JP610]
MTGEKVFVNTTHESVYKWSQTLHALTGQRDHVTSGLLPAGECAKKRDIILHEFLSPEVSRAVHSMLPEDVRSPVWSMAALASYAKSLQPLLNILDSTIKSLSEELKLDRELRLQYFEEYGNLAYEALLAK